MKAPGSPSSALQIMYFGRPGALRQNSHLVPVGKPAPPRPRRPDSLDLVDDLLRGHLEQGLLERRRSRRVAM